MPTELHLATDKLRAWLTPGRHVDDCNFWWGDDGIVGVVQRFMASTAPEDWTPENVEDLLYALGRSTTDYLAELVIQDDVAAIAIAKHALERNADASDDIAEQLGYCRQHRSEAEALLIEFAKDDHEGTRRTALLSLAKLQSAAVPALAVLAWDSGLEYQRIGALSALQMVGSDLLPQYLAEAQEDGREHLSAFAKRCAAEAAGPTASAP